MNSPAKILLIEDDAKIVKVLTGDLEYEGYEVQSTPNGAALLTMDSGFPDLLLLDIWMSGVDGRDICKHLKQKEKTSRIPIVLISASKDIEHSALDAGADDFLAKPFEIDDLLEKIERHMC